MAIRQNLQDQRAMWTLNTTTKIPIQIWIHWTTPKGREISKYLVQNMYMWKLNELCTYNTLYFQECNDQIYKTTQQRDPSEKQSKWEWKRKTLVNWMRENVVVPHSVTQITRIGIGIDIDIETHVYPSLSFTSTIILSCRVLC